MRPEPILSDCEWVYRRALARHAAQVTATTLYEAVALGLAAVRGHEWVAGIPHGLATVRVSVNSVAVEHAVKVRDFTRWLERVAFFDCPTLAPKVLLERAEGIGVVILA